jgi:hypothetical protein
MLSYNDNNFSLLYCKHCAVSLAVQSDLIHHTALHHTTVHYLTLHCTVSHFTNKHYTSFRSCPLHITCPLQVVHYIRSCTTLYSYLHRLPREQCVYVIRAGCNGSNSVLGNAHKRVIIAFHTCFRCSVVWECVVCCGGSVFRIQGKIRKGR